MKNKTDTPPAELGEALGSAVWGQMDRFDRAWSQQSSEGTLREDQREAVMAAICDHESCGNFNVGAVMREFMYQPNDKVSDGGPLTPESKQDANPPLAAPLG